MSAGFQILVAGLATLGFALLFRVVPRDLPLSAAGGSIGWAVQIAVLAVSDSSALAYFVAAIAVGLYAEIAAFVRRVPATVFIVCSIIPLVPGGGMFYTMSEAARGDAVAAARTGFETLSLAGAIAAGLAVAAAAARLMPRRRSRPAREPVAAMPDARSSG